MANIFLSWDEIEDGAFPDCCLTCGRDDTQLVSRRLETYHYRVIYAYRRYIYVDLPFCRAHASRPWIRWGRTDASEFADGGVWLKNVSPIFIEEMEAFRDEEDDYEDRRRRGKRKRRRRDDDRDDRDAPPFSRPGPARQQPPGSSGGWVALWVTLGVLAVPVVFVGACCMFGMLPAFLGGNVRVGPGPQPGFNQPPFGPNPMPPFQKKGPPFGPPFNRP